MTSTTELLELAAKAMQATRHPDFANYDEPAREDTGVCLQLGSRHGALTSFWKPHLDDGDSFRMAAWLRISVRPGKHKRDGATAESQFHRAAGATVFDDTGMAYQMRRAVLMVAADIGRKLK